MDAELIGDGDEAAPSKWRDDAPRGGVVKLPEALSVELSSVASSAAEEEEDAPPPRRSRAPEVGLLLLAADTLMLGAPPVLAGGDLWCGLVAGARAPEEEDMAGAGSR